MIFGNWTEPETGFNFVLVDSPHHRIRWVTKLLPALSAELTRRCGVPVLVRGYNDLLESESVIAMEKSGKYQKVWYRWNHETDTLTRREE